VLLGYFGEKLEKPCGNCDTCLNPVESWDGTKAAQKALYSIHQTGQRFGAMHLADILTGKETDRVRELGHQKLSAFGGGKEHATSDWASIFRQLAAMGMITVDMERHGGLRLAPEGRSVLGGKIEVRFRKDPSPRAPKQEKKRVRLVDGEPPLSKQDDIDLFDELRELRAQLARKAAVAPFVIFHDATLRALARFRPKDMEELSGITGIGEHKLNEYGPMLLIILKAHQARKTRAARSTTPGSGVPWEIGEPGRRPRR
jgi:ATP-dependent DNA helicase RecQ